MTFHLISHVYSLGLGYIIILSPNPDLPMFLLAILYLEVCVSVLVLRRCYLSMCVYNNIKQNHTEMKLPQPPESWFPSPLMYRTGAATFCNRWPHLYKYTTNGWCQTISHQTNPPTVQCLWASGRACGICAFINILHLPLYYSLCLYTEITKNETRTVGRFWIESF